MKFKRLLSYVLSFLLIFSLFNFNVKAQNGKLNIDVKKFVKQNLVNVKDVDEQRALYQKFGGEFNDNITENKIDDKDLVRVIVELQDPSAVEIIKNQKLSMKELSKVEKNVEKSQAAVIEKAKAYGKIRHVYRNVINGFSMTVAYGEIDELKKIPGVKKVTVANIYYPDINYARDITKATQVWQQFGLKGEGMVVAIVDTGIDYRHKDMKLTDPSKAKLNKELVESLGGPGKFYTDKVPYGYNFADLNDEVIDTTSSMHGMHVGGIVAANGDVKGVAPEAQLLAMKVFSNNPELRGAYTDDIAAAIDDSVKHGADVINMSLGSTAGYIMPDDPEQRAIKNATDAGVVVVVSAGNSYYSTYSYPAYAQDPDIGLVGSPGLFPDTLQVASSENTTQTLPAMDYKAGEEQGVIGYTTSEIDPYGVLKGEYELVYCGLGRTTDVANLDLTGKIALIERGAITFIEKKLNAQARGAIGVIVYNSVSGGDTYINMATDPRVVIPAIFIKRSDGLKLLNLIQNGVKVSFKGKIASTPNVNAGRMSDFSSWGLAPDLTFKPDITAPGGQIYSTVNDNSYETMSGTSMAAPHASGAVALVVQYLKQNSPNLSGRELVERAKILLTNSAIQLLDPSTKTTPKLPYLPRKQGAGLIQIDKALSTKAYVVGEDGKAVISLKDFEGNRTFKIKVTNFGTEALTFNVSDKYGVMTNFKSNSYIYPYAMPLTGAALTFSQNEITVDPGETKEIEVTVKIPETTSKNIFVEGFITLESANNPTLTIPYVGFYGKWDEPRILDSPMWEADTYYGEAALIDGEGYYLGQVGVDNYGHPIIDPEKISISTNEDAMFRSLLPVLSFLRNAKEFKLQILDENKNLLREIATDIFIRKNYASSSTRKIYANWLWDGMLYDGKGNFYPAKEGNYILRAMAKVDYMDAKWQELLIPFKIDNTYPALSVKAKKIDGNLFEFDFTGSQDNVGIYQYVVFRNEYDQNPVFVEGSQSKVQLELPGIKNDCLVFAIDFAGNVTGSLVKIDNDVIRFTEVPNFVSNNPSPTVKFEVNEMISNLVDHFEVEVIDNLIGQAIVEKKSIETSTEYTVELQDGNYTLKVYAYDATGKVIGQNETSFVIDTTKPVVTITNAEGNVVVNDTREYYDLEFKVKELTPYKVYVNGQLFDDNYTGYELRENVHVYSVKLNEGDNRVEIKVVDELGNVETKEVVITKVIERPTIIVNQVNGGYPVSGKTVLITGKVIYKQGEKVAVLINDEVATVDDEGNFAKEITLSNYGVNQVEIFAKVKNVNTVEYINVNASPINCERYVLSNASNLELKANILDKEQITKIETFMDGRKLEEYDVMSMEDNALNISLKDLFKGLNRLDIIITMKNGVVADYIDILVDKDAPSVTVFDEFGNALKNVPLYNTNTVKIMGFVAEEVKYLKINGEKVELKDESFEKILTLNEGLNKIAFTLEDLAGNKNEYAYRVYCDTQKPIIEMISSTKDKVLVDDTLELKFKAIDNVYGYRVYVNGNQVDTVESEVGDGAAKEHTINVNAIDGEGKVIISVVDYAGNVAVKEITTYKNIQKPVILEDGYFDRALAEDVVVAVVYPKENTFELQNIKYGELQLEKDKDYVVDNGQIILKKEFLKQMTKGENEFKLIFNNDYELSYKVVVVDARSNNTNLSSISINGKALEGFNPEKFEYVYEVNPFKTYTVAAQAADEKAKVEITQAVSIEGEAIIKVIAEDETEAVYKIKFIIPIQLTVEDKEFKAGEDAKVIVKAKNNGVNIKTVTLIVGVYDKNGKLVHLVFGNYNVKPDETIDMGANLSTKAEYKDYTLKVFVWDNENDMNPLSKVLEYKIK
ncbi:S8 family serine peptidase [Caloramator sp. CAR-1]|uniref:S8 family serine peptidase n=1 Tax=Caloramator sp. CAR-1 TaxID=3062777 RepID=UPI0026E193AE|nr:S8 family serine peptidase [Caloramator sp. CAR-1]MDO6355930.1 S8 family serine peptidase [Caloramator sp. CAR-1]